MLSIENVVLYYLLLINLITAIVFYADKRKAVKKKYRIAETRLHIFELLGGVFFVLPMMYLIRHKNRKFPYYVWTWMIFVAWCVLTYFAINYFLDS